jgi:hypothetical protein
MTALCKGINTTAVLMESLWRGQRPSLNLMIMLEMDSAEGAFGAQCRRPSLHPSCSGNRNPRPEMRSMWKPLTRGAILSAISIYYISLLLKLT